MDAHGFDTLARTLSVLPTRRAVLVGLMAAALPRAGTAEDDPCKPKRKRGDACENACQCRGDYRCGKPRGADDEREECGQDANAEQVCCLGPGDSCNGNDCNCCGSLFCEGGRCTKDACRSNRDCPPREVCFNRHCVAEI